MINNLGSFVKNGKKIIGVAANYKIKDKGLMNAMSFIIPLNDKQKEFISRRSLLKILNKPIPKVPEIFLKPTTSYVTEKGPIKIPKGFSVNEEVELGVIIGRTAKGISEHEAMNYVGGYCLALDMTATCRMKEARSTGGSWTLGKGFDTATPVSKFIPTSQIPDPHNLTIWGAVNKTERQNGCTADLAFNIPCLISFISQYITLEPNDLILTGSPPGMGPVQNGDVINGGIEGLIKMEFTVVVQV